MLKPQTYMLMCFSCALNIILLCQLKPKNNNCGVLCALQVLHYAIERSAARLPEAVEKEAKVCECEAYCCVSMFKKLCKLGQ